jgi:Kdo2-lipid IVA lauroyltransferase/acyltransferase
MKKVRLLISAAASYLLVALLYLISLMPLRFLYLLADLFYLVVYRTFQYRVKVCRTNIHKSFPELNDAQLLEIERKFYRHLSDIVAETIKSFTISEKELRRRMQLINPELLETYYQKNISLIAVTGHFNNWEWAAMSLPFHSRFKPQGVYLAIKNPVVNRFMIRSRSRFGIDLLEVGELYLEMEKRKNQPTISGFIADQSPSRPDKGIWMNFLNQETLVAVGTERYARQYHMGVVFGKIRKTGRGYYSLEYIPVAENGSETKEGEITLQHSRILESLICEQPEQWLWSHRRWKHKRPENILLHA